MRERQGLFSRFADGLFGINRSEGTLDELLGSYQRLLDNTEKSLYIAFPNLPAEFFQNESVLAAVKAIKNRDGIVEVIIPEKNREKNEKAIGLLKAADVMVYLTTNEISGAVTLIDEKDIVLHRPADLGDHNWEQVVMRNSMVKGEVAHDFRSLRNNATLAE